MNDAEHIQATVNVLRRRAEHLLSLAQSLEALEEEVRIPPSRENPDRSVVNVRRPSSVMERPSPKKKAVNYVKEFLSERVNEMIHYHDIAKEIINRGYCGTPRDGETIGSAAHVHRIARSLSGTLNRDKRFRSQPGGFFGLENPKIS